ncbi:MAG: hypothetical protein ACK5JT_20025, partial [Hyphomicrobiaceae bacterium]
MSGNDDGAGQSRNRVVLHLKYGNASPVALAAAVMVARAFRSEIESVVIEDTKLLDMAEVPLAREILLSGRQSGPLSRDLMQRRIRSAAADIIRQIERLAHEAEVPVRHSTL